MVVTSRLDLVRRRAAQWANALVDLSPRNPLLYFKDSVSTLDLTGAEPTALNRLATGGTVRTSSLFPDPDQRTTACKRLKVIHRRAVQAAEEQGIEIARLARGVLRVEPPQGRGSRPLKALNAPLLLQPLQIEPRTATENDYVLSTVGDLEVNPVLLVALQREHGFDFDIATFGETLNQAVERADDPREQLRVAVDLITETLVGQWSPPSIAERAVAGCFTFDKLPMMDDLNSSAELLAGHDIIAASAGDLEAVESLYGQAGKRRLPDSDEVTPADEFLVLDADSSQHAAIQAVLDGQHVVIQGPPGTGKSQTIANIIASSAAAGKRILFVTEKRAAIEAVTDRLAKVDLADLVLDLHAQRTSRKEVAQQVGRSLERLGLTPVPDAEGLHRALTDARRELAHYAEASSEVRLPWGVSAQAVERAIIDLPGHVREGPHLPRAVVERLDATTIDHLCRRVTVYVAAGGLRVRRGESAWSGASIQSEVDAEMLLLRLDNVTGRKWQESRSAMTRLVQQAGLPEPADLAGWTETLTLLAGMERSALTHGMDVHGPDLDRKCAAVGDRAWRKSIGNRDSWWERRKLRKWIEQRRHGDPCDRHMLFAELRAAVAERDTWRRLAGDRTGAPRIVRAERESTNFSRLRDDIAAIALSVSLSEPVQVPMRDVEFTLTRLRNDERTLQSLPELTRISLEMAAHGLGDILDTIVRLDCGPADAERVLRYTWYRSLLAIFRADTPILATFDEDRHGSVVADFGRLDERHLKLNSHRIRRRVAEGLRDARDRYPKENTRVLTEAKRKRGHIPVRDLVNSAHHVLLAARPCWAMSPIVVSRLLPPSRIFDLVIFDEASQIEPVDAMASIMRGSQLVVAGDDKQLPPSDYFRRLTGGSTDDEYNDDQSDDGSQPLPGLGQFESILTCLAAFIPASFRLRWHYRSADERLISFSNLEFYDEDLVTFPGRDEHSPVQLHMVTGTAAPGKGGLLDTEVDRIVELVVRHAHDRPQESLGVITANVDHQARIEEAIRRAGLGDEALAAYQSRMSGPGRRLFVKSLETVQGDERDVIVLSIGRAKGADGKLRMQLGPINREGGERRLNVAITRARIRMHVVSSVSHEDFPPTSPTRGPDALRRFLAAASKGGVPIDAGRQSSVELNGLERQVHAALVHRGIPATPQWGVAEYRIDFALADPERPGRMVLALEIDGDSYHRLTSVRDRDRLRQNQLERMGWVFHRVWASAWFADADAQMDRVENHWKEVLAARDPAPEDPDPAPDDQHSDRHGARAEREPRYSPVDPGRGSIDRYSDEELDALARWLKSDGLPLDRETRVEQMRKSLGFERRGNRILERCRAALKRVGD